MGLDEQRGREGGRERERERGREGGKEGGWVGLVYSACDEGKCRQRDGKVSARPQQQQIRAGRRRRRRQRQQRLLQNDSNGDRSLQAARGRGGRTQSRDGKPFTASPQVA